jgi:hypothetical protein
MLNAYSVSNNGTAIDMLQAQQQSLLTSQQTASQLNAKAIASVDQIQKNAIQQSIIEMQIQFTNQQLPMGRVNELGQVTGSIVNESV